MKRLLAAVAVVLGFGLLSLARDAAPAYACSPPDSEVTAESPVVVVGGLHGEAAVAGTPLPPEAGTGAIVLTAERDIPWGSVVMVTILVMSFAGGTLAIVRSSRRRR